MLDPAFVRTERFVSRLGGLPMLIAQAAEQFKLWTGVDGSEGVMREAADQALELDMTSEI